jgi:hypothetical protein
VNVRGPRNGGMIPSPAVTPLAFRRMPSGVWGANNLASPLMQQ